MDRLDLAARSALDQCLSVEGLEQARYVAGCESSGCGEILYAIRRARIDEETDQSSGLCSAGASAATRRRLRTPRGADRTQVERRIIETDESVSGEIDEVDPFRGEQLPGSSAQPGCDDQDRDVVRKRAKHARQSGEQETDVAR